MSVRLTKKEFMILPSNDLSIIKMDLDCCNITIRAKLFTLVDPHSYIKLPKYERKIGFSLFTNKTYKWSIPRLISKEHPFYCNMTWEGV